MRRYRCTIFNCSYNRYTTQFNYTVDHPTPFHHLLLPCFLHFYYEIFSLIDSSKKRPGVDLMAWLALLGVKAWLIENIVQLVVLFSALLANSDHHLGERWNRTNQLFSRSKFGDEDKDGPRRFWETQSHTFKILWLGVLAFRKKWSSIKLQFEDIIH